MDKRILLAPPIRLTRVALLERKGCGLLSTWATTLSAESPMMAIDPDRR